jgi:hypothetical protein
MPKQITLRFVVRTLTRLKHATKLGPEVLAYVLVKKLLGQASYGDIANKGPFYAAFKRIARLNAGAGVCVCIGRRAIFPMTAVHECSNGGHRGGLSVPRLIRLIRSRLICTSRSSRHC